MADTRVSMISREVIKPSSSKTEKMKPYKMSYFDQLTPSTYVPVILFYSMEENSNISKTLTLLKSALSKTLDIYYPFSGRIRNNVVVDSFHEGVPFQVSQVSCTMADFLIISNKQETELLNKVLPCQPFSIEHGMEMPIISIQISVFTCGGIAIGMCFQHKLGDAMTFAYFIKTWATFSLGSEEKLIVPNLSKASTVFPPANHFPENHVLLMNTLWFSQQNLVTKKFVFDAKSISTLRSTAKGQDNRLPSQLETLTAFIWKCYMNGGRASSNPTKASLLVQAVNIRPRSTPELPHNAIGNLFWWGSALGNSADTEGNELYKLLEDMRVGVSVFDDEYLKSLQGDEGYEVLANTLDQLEEIICLEKPDILAFTSWCHLGLNKMSFGWGEPVWVAVMGKPGLEFRNLIVFFEANNEEKGIEAWITLENTRMAALEQDALFNAFASPYPTTSKL